MPKNTFDLSDPLQVAGAVYFVMGRGTEGGKASYHLSITGVTNASNATDPGWGDVHSVIAASGYTLGSVQVDFGQRGTWPLGAIAGRELNPGERTYVQAVVDEAASYANAHGLPFTNDIARLESDLLTNGRRLRFIDTNTRDAINQWASSKEGQQWIHQNIDLPQVRNVTTLALALMETHGKNIQEDKRLEVVCMLAKTANQLPGMLPRLESALANGADYDQFMKSVSSIHGKYRFYAAEHAGAVASRYEDRYAQAEFRDALVRANTAIMEVTYDPSRDVFDTDIQAALSAIGQQSRVVDTVVANIQHNLNQLGITDARGQPLMVDGNPGGPNSHTNQAIAAFQERFGIEGERSNAELLTATQVALNNPISNLDRTMRDLLPPGLQPQVPRMVNGMPDYLLPGGESAQKVPATPTPQHANRNAPTHDTPPPQPVESATLPPLPRVELQQGDRGAAVLALQAHLRMIGATDRAGRALQPDRDYGARTKEAVEQFQLWTSRETTGVADKDTLQALETQARFAVRQRAQGVPAGDHLADNLEPLTPADAALAADPYLPPTYPTPRTTPSSPASPAITDPAQSRQPTGLQPFSHPDHPQHALYADVRQRFGAKGIELSEAQLSDLTRQMHGTGYAPGWEGDVTVYKDKAVVGSFQIGSRMASVDMTTPAPSVQDTMKAFQADQQTLAQGMERLHQQQAVAQDHHGLGL